MARKPRLHVPGALYHVTLRGNHQHAIFPSSADRTVLDLIVAEALERFTARLHAYCWMTNHVHLLVQVNVEPLGRLMQVVGSRYARHAQHRLGTTGHFFERRYHALLVDADAYLLELVRYIHRNPVRGGLVTDPADYPWSSHRMYLGLEERAWVTTGPTLRMLSEDIGKARSAYRRFINAAIDIDDEVSLPPPNEDDPRILGDVHFLDGNAVNGMPRRNALTLEDLAAAICREASVSVSAVRSVSRARHLSPVRALIVRRAADLQVATPSETARFLNRALSSITRLTGRYCK